MSDLKSFKTDPELKNFICKKGKWDIMNSLLFCTFTNTKLELHGF